MFDKVLNTHYPVSRNLSLLDHYITYSKTLFKTAKCYNPRWKVKVTSVKILLKKQSQIWMLFYALKTKKEYKETTEAVTWKCSVRKVFLEISQNSQEITCARVSFLIKLSQPATLLKKRLSHRCFPVNFAKFLRTLFLQNTSGGYFYNKSKRKTLCKQEHTAVASIQSYFRNITHDFYPLGFLMFSGGREKQHRAVMG